MTAASRKRPTLTTFAAQAVLDGVYVRSPRFAVLVSRVPGGGMRVRCFSRSGWSRQGLWSKPFFRGFAASVDSFVSGVEGLLESAHMAASSPADPDSRTSASWSLWLIPLLALVAGAALFAIAPLLLRMGLGFDGLQRLAPFELQFLETGARLVAAGLCLCALPVSGEIRRFLRYQGACNKALGAFESGADLTMESAASVLKVHPLCAPSLAIAVVPAALLLFGLAFPYAFFEGLTPLPVVDYGVSVVARLLLLPPIAALAHETLRAGLLRPVQGWIVREPGESELEAALVAMRQLLRLEKDPSRDPEEEFEVATLNELGGLRVPAEDYRER